MFIVHEPAPTAINGSSAGRTKSIFVVCPSPVLCMSSDVSPVPVITDIFSWITLCGVPISATFCLSSNSNFWSSVSSLIISSRSMCISSINPISAIMVAELRAARSSVRLISVCVMAVSAM